MKIIRKFLIFLIITLLITQTSYADTYYYDSLNRLKEVVTDTYKLVYTYDNAGNILSVTHVPLHGTVTSIATDQTTYTLEINKTAKVAVKATFQDTSTENVTDGVTYQSSNVAVAEVDASGTIAAKAVGQATLTVTYEGKITTAEIKVTTLADTLPPTTPSALSMHSITETSATLEWVASTDNTAVKGYNIYRDNIKIASTASTTYTNSSLVPGTTYIFKVIAYDTAGNVSEVSQPISVTTLSDTQPPAVPTKLMIQFVTETTAALSWCAATDNISIKCYEVYRDNIKIKTVTTTSYIDTNLIPGKEYIYMVKACDAAGNLSEVCSPVKVMTNVDAEAPTVPENLEASNVTEVSIGLAWPASTDNIKLKGYEVYREGIKIRTVFTNTFTDTELTPGKTYTYTVKAFDIAGNYSAECNELVVTTLPGNGMPIAPTNFIISEVTQSTVALSWLDETVNSAEKAYEIYRDGIMLGTTTKTTFTDINLTPGRSYNYMIKVIDLVRNVCVGNNQMSVTTISDNDAPSVPTNLYAAAATETAFTLVWTASIDNVSVKGYYIYRDGVKIASTTKATYTNSNLIPGKTYSYIVKSYDTAGNISTGSNLLYEITLPDYTAPTTPTQFSATEVTETAVTLEWMASSDNVALNGYQIFRDGVKIGLTGKTTFTDSGLVSGKTYAYLIKAYDTAGNLSDDSNFVKVTTIVDETLKLSAVTIKSNGVNPAMAKVGDMVTVSFATNKSVESPAVSIANHAAIVSGSDTSWTATYTMQSSDSEGVVPFSIVIDILTETVATDSSSVTFDKTAPKITILGNNPIKVILGSKYIDAGATASDDAKISSVSNVNTSVVGTYTVTYTAIDSAYNKSTVTRTVNVVYAFGGVLQPINSDASSIFKAGSNIPVKFQLKDANGNYISTAKATISYAKVTNNVIGTVVEAESTSSATTGNQFRYDASNNQYIFNLSTKTGFATGTYQLTIQLDDNKEYSVKISIK